MSPELRIKLKLALAGRAKVEMGQLQFLNLEAVRRRAGDDWPKLRAKIYDVGASFIEKRLDPDDVLFRCQGGFLIIFSVLSGDAATTRVAEVAKALEAFFLGDGALQDLEVTADSRNVSPTEFLDILSSTQPEDVTDRPSWQPGGAPDNRRIGDAQRVAWTASEPTADAPPVPPRWTEPVRKTPLLPWDEIVFKPCWDARRNAVTHHLCLASRIVNGWPAYGRDTFSVFDSKPLNRLLDQTIAIAAQRGFQRVHAEGGTCGIIVPVHYDTLSSLSERMSYFAILQSVPQALRQHFVLRIDAIPEGAPVAQMQELIRSMRPFGSKTMASLPYGMADLRRFEGSGIGLFETAIPHRLGEGEVSTATVQAVLGLVTAAADLKAEAVLTQIESPSLFGASVSAGVRLFSGNLIGHDRPTPAPVQAVEFNEIVHRSAPPDDEAHVVRI